MKMSPDIVDYIPSAILIVLSLLLIFSRRKQVENEPMDEPPTPSFPWVRFTLLFAVIIAAGMLAQQYFKAPINRTLELTTYSSEVPSATTATLQLHQDGTVTWQRPPSMNDRIWFLPKLGIRSEEKPVSAGSLPVSTGWVDETLKELGEKFDPNKP